MPINFFETRCQTSTNEIRFGLCDDPPPPNNPAYIDFSNRAKWIAEVSNPNAETVVFTAIDSCIEILRLDGTHESRCDGMLTYKNVIVFVELKERRGNRNAWIAKADAQLRNTIRNFANNHDLSVFSTKIAYVANSLRPNMQNFKIERKQKFKDDTGFILKIQTDIAI